MTLNGRTKKKKNTCKGSDKGIGRKKKLEILVLDAIHCKHKSWSSVSSQTDSNSFRYTGFITKAKSEEILREGIEEHLGDPKPLETLLQIANEKRYIINDVTAFINIDNEITIYSQATI